MDDLALRGGVRAGAADATGRRTEMNTMIDDLPGHTQVLVAGGGPVGLAAAIELGRRGIKCLVVEPRTTVSHARPRCKTLNVRTMEHFRRWGIGDRLRQRAPLPVSFSTDIVFCTSLTGYELSRFSGVLGLALEGDRFPETGQQAPQYVLEELLREVVDELAACCLVVGLRVGAVAQRNGTAEVTVLDETGRSAIVSAEYVLGCDGPRSAVRAAIGAAYSGERALRPNFGMVFRAPKLWDHVRHGPAVQYWILNHTAPALMGPVDLQGTWWMIAFNVDRKTGERDGRAIIDCATGTPVDATVLSTDPWTAHMQIVDRARQGRVFLAGDAAHLNPPFGGHGLNTGLSDAVDLGWKLAAVLDGWAGPGLLESYEAERRPVQTQVIAAAEANNRVLATDLLAEDIDRDGPVGALARERAHDAIQASKRAEFHALELVLDLGYENSPVIAPAPAGTGPARPGLLLPHAWINEGESLYDRLGPGMTLLAGDDLPGEALEPLTQAARDRRVPLSTVRAPARMLRAKVGTDLALVRPDQHLAWLGDSAPQDPVALIDLVRGERRS
jgi:2-polyprenyl-6-methoxyphenol hydroxylase-like FAD-dependent oxidoreductase